MASDTSDGSGDSVKTSSGRGPNVRRVAADRVEADNVTRISVGDAMLAVDWADSVEIREDKLSDGCSWVSLWLNDAFAGQAPGWLSDVRIDGERVPAWEPAAVKPTARLKDGHFLYEMYEDRWLVDNFDATNLRLEVPGLPKVGDFNDVGTHRVTSIRWELVSGTSHMYNVTVVYTVERTDEAERHVAKAKARAHGNGFVGLQTGAAS